MTNDLLIRFLKGEASSEESRQIKMWLDEDPENKARLRKVHQNYLTLNLYTYDNDDYKYQIAKTKSLALSNKKNRSRALWYYVASVAAVALLIIIGINSLDYSKNNISQMALMHSTDIKKGGLTLSDGRFFPAQSFDNEIQISKNKISINKKEINNISKGNHILVVKEGSTAYVKLPDGTLVHLNSGSVFSFPNEFDDKARNVYLDGEGYFKVTKNGATFTVNTETKNIEVLGTSFNVCAYSKDNLFQTVLVEGSIAVKSGDENTLIVPNQAYSYNKNIKTQKVIEVDTKPYVSWVHNQLLFNNEKLGLLLNRLERFYGVEIKTSEHNVRNYQISGSLNLKPKIEETLSILLQTLPKNNNRQLTIKQEGSTVLIQ